MTSQAGPFSVSFTLGYDNNSDLTSLVDGSVYSQTSSYDTDSRLLNRTVTMGVNAEKATFSYETAGRLYSVTDSIGCTKSTNEGTITYGYNSKEQLTSISTSWGPTFGYPRTTIKRSEKSDRA